MSDKDDDQAAKDQEAKDARNKKSIQDSIATYSEESKRLPGVY